ncbi:MAG: DUF6279 family lipoprotein [Rhizobacter sp.]|nr:DUF6279 family lipoprotein [Rhizobacter sp.]
MALCLALTLLGGCSALRIGYNQGADLVYWWLDGYADFDDAQARRARGALSDWFAWHRRTQLPEYARLLARAQADVAADTSPEQICNWWSSIGKRIETSLEQAIPAAADLMLELTAPQLQHIEQRYAKKNAEFRDDFLNPDPLERRRATVKRYVDRAESIYGRLDEAQREQVARMVAASPFDTERWFSERVQRQQDALQMMRRLTQERADRDQAQAALRAYSNRWTRSPREDYRRYADTLLQFNCALVAALHNSSTPAQRQAAAQKFKGWENDARALAADAAR